jgi:hypothetical protein
MILMYEWKLEISAMYCPFAEIREHTDGINRRHCNINHELCSEINCENVDQEAKIYGGVVVEG